MYAVPSPSTCRPLRYALATQREETAPMSTETTTPATAHLTAYELLSLTITQREHAIQIVMFAGTILFVLSASGIVPLAVMK